MSLGICEFSPSRQALVLFGSFSLYFVYQNQLFAYQAYNHLALALAIMALLWWLTIFLRWLAYTETIQKKADTLPTLKLPSTLKCLLPHSKCEAGDLNLWSLLHLVAYAIIGYFVPNQYLAVIYLSFVFELIELGMGNTSKLIVDPITNLLGYVIGSSLSPYSYSTGKRSWRG